MEEACLTFLAYPPEYHGPVDALIIENGTSLPSRSIKTARAGKVRELN